MTSTPKDYGTFTFAGKRAVVTGGGSGIGRMICELFAKRGAAVHILDLSEAQAKEVADDINSTNPLQKAQYHVVNVVDQAAIESVFDEIAAQSRIDVLINNAGIGHVGDVVATKTEHMDRMYKVNILGVYNCLKAGVKHMLADKKGGAIVNLASIASTIGLADRFAYSMSKGAVLTMTLSVATDYVKKGIRCNCMAPARIHTPFVDAYLKKNYPGKEQEVFNKLSAYQPIGRMGKPEEVAALALYLASDEACFVTGANFAIDGGVAAKM
jgi:NAD(P)-dependent dehydrogenase (short-subunit alcohol dehydrogenase family)